MTSYALRSMAPRKASRIQNAREHRRRVVLPARLRHGPSWSDACILNISSRGLMIHTGRQIAKGTKVEVRRGDHVIVARVVWRDGARAGLQAEDRVPVEALMTFVQSPAFQLVAATGARRKKARPGERNRLRGRAYQIRLCGRYRCFLGRFRAENGGSGIFAVDGLGCGGR